MFIPRILVSLCMPSFQEKSLVMINCLVNYSGVVKVHIMAKLVCVSRNFRIAVANKDSSSISTRPCGKCCIRLALICEIAIKVVFAKSVDYPLAAYSQGDYPLCGCDVNYSHANPIGLYLLVFCGINWQILKSLRLSSLRPRRDVQESRKGLLYQSKISYDHKDQNL